MMDPRSLQAMGELTAALNSHKIALNEHSVAIRAQNARLDVLMGLLAGLPPRAISDLALALEQFGGNVRVFADVVERQSQFYLR